MKNGQISITVAAISAVGMIMAAAFTSWATASTNLAQVNARIDVVEERENNHYAEVQKQLSAMDRKLDAILKNQ